jgi:hypothetical protein
LIDKLGKLDKTRRTLPGLVGKNIKGEYEKPVWVTLENGQFRERMIRKKVKGKN